MAAKKKATKKSPRKAAKRKTTRRVTASVDEDEPAAAGPSAAASPKAASPKAAVSKAAASKAAASKAAASKATSAKAATAKGAASKDTPSSPVARMAAEPQASAVEAPAVGDRQAQPMAAGGQEAPRAGEASRARSEGSTAASPSGRTARVSPQSQDEDGSQRPARPNRLVRGRRRGRGRRSEREEGAGAGRVIPPLPDGDEEFVPFVSERPRGRSVRDSAVSLDPRALLDRVRRGDVHIRVLDDMDTEGLRALAESEGLPAREGEQRRETIYRLVEAGRGRRVEENSLCEGLLELHPDGYGFLRRRERNYVQHPEDVYVAAGLVRRYGLDAGHWVTGQARRKRADGPDLALHAVDQVNDQDPARLADLTPFDQLTVVYPDTRFVLETTPEEIEMRVMDLFCPLGLGQRALIVAPPRTGKTIMLQKLADAIATNSPNVHIVVLLVDERPEEVTNMRRSVRGEVIASTFDKPAANHVRVAELVMEKVKRMVEFGLDVVLLLDSITRMGRAYNNQTGGSGRILTGGLDAGALTKPKRFFGSARNVEHGGSLTIVATALIDTGSRMDEVIFEEFKGTGNMELVLNRDLANSRIWPAIDIPASGTRNEDLLLHPDELRRVTLLRRGVAAQEPQAVLVAIRDQLRKYKTNAEFLLQLGN